MYNIKLTYLILPFILTLGSSFTSLSAQSSTCVPSSVNSSNNSLWSPDCYLDNNCEIQGNPCQANDIDVIGVFVADILGNPILACSPGDVINAYLWTTFANTTGTDRYAVRAYAEVELNGVFTGAFFNGCAFDVIPASSTQDQLLIPITFNCGENVNLINIWTAWDTNTGSTCSTATPTSVDCGDYPPSKCYNNIDIGGVSVLVPNFSFDCGDAPNEICFTDLVSGGDGNYTYAWDFGDNSSISNVASPCYTYASPGVYTVTLTVTGCLCRRLP